MIQSIDSLRTLIAAEFPNSELEAGFIARTDRRKHSMRLFFMAFGVLAFGAHGILDYFVAGEMATLFLSLRLGVACPLMIFVTHAFYKSRFSSTSRANLLIALYVLIPGFTIIAMGIMATGPAADVYPFGTMILLSYSAAFLTPRHKTMALISFILVGSFWGTAYFSNSSTEALVANAFFLTVGLLAVIIGTFVLERVERQQYRYSRRLQQTIANLRRSESQAMSLYREAKQAERAKNEFLAVVSHELRTPLNAIIGFSEIMKMGMLGKLEPPAYGDYAKDIHSSGKQLLGIIDDILDVSRADMGKMDFVLDEFDPSSAAAQAVKACEVACEDSDVSIVHEPCRADDVFMNGDPKRMTQALTNVIGNAVKFSNGSGTVTVREFFDRHGNLRIAISDQGIGISEADLERIRQPFQQAEQVLTRDNGGLGLGLAIADIVAKGHDGHLEIDSTLGVGTTVTVVIPAKRLVQSAAA